TEEPLMLIFEDLHWVDPSSLDFISAFARRRAAAKLMLLCTYRPVDVVLSRSPLKRLKQDLKVHHLCEEIALERLEESDIAEYLAAGFEGNVPYELAKVGTRHADDNDLFL